MAQTLAISRQTSWPEISLAKEFVQEEKNILKKITKIFLCIILSPAAFFLDISHNVSGLFNSKTINSKTKKDDNKLTRFIDITKYIWANHKKALAIGSLAIGASIGVGYLYYSIRPFLEINKSYGKCQKRALHQINFLQNQCDIKQKEIKKEISKTSIFNRDRLRRLNKRSKRTSSRSQSEKNIAQPAANRALLLCKNNYNASFEKIKDEGKLLSLLFNVFKYELD